MPFGYNKWWANIIRERNFFGYRYWWFNWIFWGATFAIFFFLWNGYHTQKEYVENTNYNDSLFSQIHSDLRPCCGCTIGTYEDPNIDTMPTPPPPPNNPPEGSRRCDEENHSGGYGEDEKRIFLGEFSGRVTLVYNMKAQPDKLEVFYEGHLIVSTKNVRGNDNGYVGDDNIAGGKGKLVFNFIHNIEDVITVKVYGKYPETKWSYTVGCPQ